MSGGRWKFCGNPWSRKNAGAMPPSAVENEGVFENPSWLIPPPQPG
jgi:hypothetical protein